VSDEVQGIDLDRAISLNDARKLMRGRGGKRPALDTVRRWSNPRRGCYPLGKDGPRLLLRTIKFNGEVLTTAEWVRDFERRRVMAALGKLPREGDAGG
jgi:hypothetical protein